MVKRKEERGTFLEKEVKSIAPFLLIIGVIQIIFSSYLSAGWGVILLIAGIASFFYPREWMYLGFGIGLIVIGISNISVSINFWIIFGVIQIALGIYVITRYNKLKKKNKKKLTGGQKFLMILGIVLLSVIALFAISFIELLYYQSYEYDNRIGETDEDTRKLIKIHIELLEEEGYEVLYFGNLAISEDDDEDPYVKMKSLGTRNYQVESGLSSLSLVYPNAPEYTIRILEEDQDCWYTIRGDIDRAVFKGGELRWKNGTLVDSNSAYRLLQYQIENPTCS